MLTRRNGTTVIAGLATLLLMVALVACTREVPGPERVVEVEVAGPETIVEVTVVVPATPEPAMEAKQTLPLERVRYGVPGEITHLDPGPPV